MGVERRVFQADRKARRQICPWETLRRGFRPYPHPLTPFAMLGIGYEAEWKNLVGGRALVYIPC